MVSGGEGVAEGEQHGDTHADQEGRVDQAGQNEHGGLQFAHQFRLAGGAFQELATHQGDTDRSAESTQAHDDAAGDCDVCCIGHERLLSRDRQSQ